MVNDSKWKTAATVRRLIIIVLATAVVGVLVYVSISPFGAKVIYEVAGSDSKRIEMIRPFTSEEVVGRGEDGAFYSIPKMKMTTDEVSFNLELPYGEFDKAVARIEYWGDPDDLLIGVKDNSSQEYSSKIIHNKALNDLDWNKVTDDGVVLFQKEKQFNSVSDFLDAIPSFVHGEGSGEEQPVIATYHYEIKQPKPRVDISRVNSGSRIQATLRGDQVIYVYVKDEPLDIHFSKQDLNLNSGGDVLEIVVYDGNEMVYSQTIQDDEDISASGVPGTALPVDVVVPGLEEGVYMVHLACTNDVLIKDITSTQKYLVFYDHLFLADHSLYQVGETRPATIYTDAQVLTASTFHTEALQTLTINDESFLVMGSVNRSYVQDMTEPVNKINVEMGSVLLSSENSVFAFSGDSFFDPFPLEIEPFREDRLFNVDYIVAGYDLPEKKGSMWLNEVTFDLSEENMTDGEVGFRLLSNNLMEDKQEITIELLNIALEKK